jgi:GTP-binding protein
MTPLFEAIVKNCPPPDVDENGPLQLQVSLLDYSSYVGAIGIGRIKRGKIRRNSPVVVVDREGKVRNERIMQVMGFLGLHRVEAEEASAGDIVAFAGIEYPEIPRRSATRSAGGAAAPGGGRADDQHDVRGEQLAVLRPRRQVRHQPPDPRAAAARGADQCRAARRGNRRSRQVPRLRPRRAAPRRAAREHAARRLRARGLASEVVIKEIEGQPCEPYETLAVDLDESTQGAIMQELGERGGQLTGMYPDGKGRVRLDYVIPSRGLIGFSDRVPHAHVGHRHHAPHLRSLRPVAGPGDRQRTNGVLISNAQGKVLAYSLFNLQERGRLMASHGDEVTKGRSSASTAATTTWSSIR